MKLLRRPGLRIGRVELQLDWFLVPARLPWLHSSQPPFHIVHIFTRTVEKGFAERDGPVFFVSSSSSSLSVTPTPLIPTAVSFSAFSYSFFFFFTKYSQLFS